MAQIRVRSTASSARTARASPPLTRALCTLLAPSEAALDDKQTGAKMLRLQVRFYGLSRRDTERRLADLREGSSTSVPRSRTRVSTYSGGMKRRLDRRRRLHTPQRALFDEPDHGAGPGRPRRGLAGVRC